MKHTPGPWKVIQPEHDPNAYDVATEAGGQIARLPWKCEANARLIAAAPELFEALRDLREACVDAYKQARIEAEPFVRAGNVLARITQS